MTVPSDILNNFNKLITILTGVHLYGCLQGFIIQDLLKANAGFTQTGKISQPEHLKQIPRLQSQNYVKGLNIRRFDATADMLISTPPCILAAVRAVINVCGQRPCISEGQCQRLHVHRFPSFVYK